MIESSRRTETIGASQNEDDISQGSHSVIVTDEISWVADISSPVEMIELSSVADTINASNCSGISSR